MSKSTKKVRDKWRAKDWYSIYTPSYFGELNVANIPATESSGPLGRVIENTLYDVTGDFSHQSTKLYFLVVSFKGDRADTILKGHEYSADYLRSLVRRGRQQNRRYFQRYFEGWLHDQNFSGGLCSWKSKRISAAYDQRNYEKSRR